MKAYVFPGQGAQFTGMGKDLYENSALAAALFEKANEILGFRITDIMFEGTAEELKETKVTQPAIFLHSVILAKTLEDFKPEMVAGHSLGEFSALVANGVLSFEDGLRLVSQRALAMFASYPQSKRNMEDEKRRPKARSCRRRKDSDVGARCNGLLQRRNWRAETGMERPAHSAS